MKLVGNYLYLVVAEVVSKAVTLAAFAYMSRVIGRDGMGLIEFASSAFLCAALAVDMGFGSYGAREIAKHPARTEELTSQVLFVRLIMSAIAFMGMALLAWWADSAVTHTDLMIVYGLCLIGLPFLLQWVFQGHQWMGAVAGLNLVRQGIFALVVFFGLRGSENLLMVAWAEVMGVLGSALLGIWLYRRWFHVPLRIARRTSRELITQSATIGLVQIFWSIRMFGATVLLGLIATTDHIAEVAYFGGAMRILVALHTFIWLYYFNLLPALSKNWHEDRLAFVALTRDSMCLMGWIAFAGVCLWVVLAPAVIRIAYGGQYAAGGPVLQWMGGVALSAALSGHFRFGLVASGYQKDALITSSVGAVVALTLVPLGFFWRDAVGAAMGLVVADAVVWLLSWMLATRRLGALGHANSLLRPLGAVAAVIVIDRLMPITQLWAHVALILVLLGTFGWFLDAHLRSLVWRLVGSRINPLRVDVHS